MYADLPKGQPPVPPALLALATILQAYTGVSDAEAVEACVMDRRWQLVLDCLDCADAPFSKGTLVAFRERLIAADLDRRLIERTVEVAAQTKGFGHQQLRLALDSSPLWGAGRVEDTLQSLGACPAQSGGHDGASAGAGGGGRGGGGGRAAAGRDEPEGGAGCGLGRPGEPHLGAGGGAGGAGGGGGVCGGSSRRVRRRRRPRRAVAVAQQVVAQDVEQRRRRDGRSCGGAWPATGASVWRTPRCAMGARAASQLVDGYKRHVGRDLDSGLVRVVGLTAANAPEASVTPAHRRRPGRQAGHLANCTSTAPI